MLHRIDRTCGGWPMPSLPSRWPLFSGPFNSISGTDAVYTARRVIILLARRTLDKGAATLGFMTYQTIGLSSAAGENNISPISKNNTGLGGN